jgi:hypothetical protein
MRVSVLALRGREAFSNLILRSALFARVSKDGRESFVVSILRDAAKRPLLRMRSVLSYQNEIFRPPDP